VPDSLFRARLIELLDELAAIDAFQAAAALWSYARHLNKMADDG
jgi:hypothetical protein